MCAAFLTRLSWHSRAPAHIYTHTHTVFTFVCTRQSYAVPRSTMMRCLNGAQCRALYAPRCAPIYPKLSSTRQHYEPSARARVYFCLPPPPLPPPGFCSTADYDDERAIETFPSTSIDFPSLSRRGRDIRRTTRSLH